VCKIDLTFTLALKQRLGVLKRDRVKIVLVVK
jgi:hypothetical protein